MRNFTLNILLLLVISCSTSTEPDITTFIETGTTPIITGIYKTTITSPDGTGKILGFPSYSHGPINVFPNPLYNNTSNKIFRNIGKLTISHLPRKVKIVIVKGTHLVNTSKSILINNSINSIKQPIIVRTLEKNNNSAFFTWDLKDKLNKEVPMGLYRIFLESNYFQEEYSTKIIWIDFYLIRFGSSVRFNDPTGWLNFNGTYILPEGT